jgi:hypothetical protein
MDKPTKIILLIRPTTLLWFHLKGKESESHPLLFVYLFTISDIDSQSIHIKIKAICALTVSCHTKFHATDAACALSHTNSDKTIISRISCHTNFYLTGIS